MDEDCISKEETILFKNTDLIKVIHWTNDIYFNNIIKNIHRYAVLSNTTPYFDESLISTSFYQLPLELMFNYDADILLDPEITIICYIDRIGINPVLLSDVKIYTSKNNELVEYKISKYCEKCLLFILPKPQSDTMIPRISLLVSTDEIDDKILKYFDKITKANNSEEYEKYEKIGTTVYEQSKLTNIEHLERKLFRYYILNDEESETGLTLYIDLFLYGDFKQSKKYILNLLIMYIEYLKQFINSPRLDTIIYEDANLLKQEEYCDIPSYLLMYYPTSKISKLWQEKIISDCDSVISQLHNMIL